MIMTTLSSAVKEQGYSTPGILMTAGPRGAAVRIHRMDQKPQRTRDAVVKGSSDYYLKVWKLVIQFFKKHAL